MKAVVFSLGCKVNQCEGQSIISAFNKRGITATDKLEYADFYVLNTCSVTAEADRKSRQAVSRALKFNPAAKIYVCGCSSQNNGALFEDKPNVRIVSGTAQKMNFAELILSDLFSDECVSRNCVHNPPAVYEDDLHPFHTKTRSYIKIQDGCNNFCSYCIIPYLRGRSRSRAADSIVAEAVAAAENSKEIVLTGINVSAYGSDIGTNLTDLVKRLGKVSARKRIGSLECTVISYELLQAMRENGFCDHFHLSLQSGSASVLRRMNRKYTPEFYLEKVDEIRKVFPDAGITTDVITGFAGETQEEFAQTAEFVIRAEFSDMHVFPYSERKGTNACKLAQIDKSVRQERALELIEISRRMREKFCENRIGKIYDVYAETEEQGESAGYTSNYMKVYSDVPVGELKKIKIIQKYKEGVKAVNYEK
ncbi:tRNA (N(6)-L-threonylcarbamoyladenosine(37)-C(2))-methylthiotransferase MtaB [Pumilibacter intestinalis]|uniref:tRNA (N(6)-L-threonylcarbamoyladenosine(37)-C(2))- methylthiotransferase MtaB n=1 Tax=Pumilibacter intestinalis TaxID=2941511 RepID=UPI00203EB6E7|nr:tRNA (N(6)-L-threonylcarbamoyladenosine(37)-C(2))-methylthiotransferase MtaB [Pumilibacter intestinalis]